MSLRVSTSTLVTSACSGLMYAGVPRNCSKAVKTVLSVSRWSVVALAMPKVDHFGHCHAVVNGDQNVRWFDVPVDDPFLVSVLDCVANLHEEVQPLLRGQILLVAVLGDLGPAHQFHHKVWPAGLSSPRVMNF